uniref:Uncharacterized protein n=1 Tax=Anguilla anguilla TaxID=7936 RepID=A0A0E9Q7Z2_ANGAN
MQFHLCCVNSVSTTDSSQTKRQAVMLYIFFTKTNFIFIISLHFIFFYFVYMKITLCTGFIFMNSTFLHF